METPNNGQNAPKEFGKFREFFWPIHSFELKKFIPMSLLMFFILFVYTMVRDIKDVAIQKFAVCGSTELLPTLKLWFVMPAAILIVMLFSFLVNKFGSEKTFYIMISIFLGFFLIFILFLFPNQDKIHANLNTVRSLQASSPAFLHYIIPCVTNWSFTLFYIFAEIWSTIALGSLFWQFANQITKKSEVKRFFALFALLGNIGTFLSGTTLTEMSRASGETFKRNLTICIWLCIIFGIAAMATYYYINKYVMTDKRFYDPALSSGTKPKEKMGMLDGLKYLFKSPYIALICVLVLGYGASINFFEFIWKAQMSATLPANELSIMMGRLSQAIGIITILMTWFGAYVLRKFKWTVGAMFTPAILAFFGSIFFIVMFYNRTYSEGTIFGVSASMFAVWIGLLVDALSKSVKYCLFDTTRSMAYLPLSNEESIQGRAAVEVVGTRAGKAGAASVTYILTNIVSAGSRALNHVYTVAIFFGAVVTSWIWAVLSLGKKYDAKMEEKNKS